MKIPVPCYDEGRKCQERTEYCHSTCQRYKDYVQAKDAERDKINAKKSLDKALDDFAVNQQHRVRRKQQADHSTRKRWGICTTSTTRTD